MGGTFPVMLELPNDAILPPIVVYNFNIVNGSTLRTLFDWYNYILPSLTGVKHPVSVPPSTPNILDRVKNNPLISLVDQIKVAQIREEIRLCETELHNDLHSSN
jgi:hypothetical protein